ncbi:hypothetical protein TELCIR_09466 [Teladorsagia circumcincta]|uniref:Uncharacterized protein n=1 Tax=Teladorsagia circumcincta TaxID=45464 RepID=A0A2G9UEX4_TELCI|nr:hypothetical protein TELCIR_09466 [Teladorsagia circumcincta]
MASEQTPDGKKRVVVYTRETYDRKIEVSRTTQKPEADNGESMLPKDRPPILPPFPNAQVHTENTKVDNKVVDGKFVRTETFTEHMMKEDKKNRVEPVGQ